MFARFCAIIFVASAFAACGAESTNRLEFPKVGFSIAPLEASPGDAAQQVILMSLPVADKFTPNVNVQVQPYKGTIDDYVAVTEKQFKSHKVTVIERKKISDSALQLEYAGTVAGQTLHWYGRAEKSGNHIYLATATTTENLWTNQSAALKACVDSFRCDPPAAVATPAAAPAKQ